MTKRTVARAVSDRQAFKAARRFVADQTLNDDERTRYLRHILLKEVGAQGQLALKGAHVLLIGLGGLGAPILSYLVGAGIGRLTIIDPDTVDLSNLQRQTIYASDDQGRAKVEAARDFAARLNPSVEINPCKAHFSEGNATSLLEGADLVIEGVDNFEARFVANRAAMAARVPLLSAAIGRFDGQLSLFTPYAGDLPCYRCLVPEAPPREVVLTCAEEGVLGPLAGVMGALTALEAIKTLAGFGETLAGRLLIYDGLAQRMRSITLPRDPACQDCADLSRDPFNATMRLA